MPWWRTKQTEWIGISFRLFPSSPIETADITAQIETIDIDGNSIKKTNTITTTMDPHTISKDMKIQFDNPIPIRPDDIVKYSLTVTPTRSDEKEERTSDIEAIAYEDMRSNQLDTSDQVDERPV